MPRRSAAGFGFSGFLVRWLVALVLVALTYNPIEYSYVHWLMGSEEANLPLMIGAGLVLLIGYIIYIRSTWRSIGPIGVVLILALLGVIGWLLVDLGWISVRDPGVVSWAAILAASLVMGVGMSWSHIRRRISGQYDMDDVDQA